MQMLIVHLLLASYACMTIGLSFQLWRPALPIHVGIISKAGFRHEYQALWS